MSRRGALLLAGAAGLAAAGCAPALPPPATTPNAAGDPAALAAWVHSLAREVDGAPTASRRAALAQEALEAGQRCEQAAPGWAPCDYALAIALGITVREHPSTLRDGLSRMAALLRRAAATDPAIDRSGPDRVLALMLLRAPSWPIGPGDPEEGLAAARRAVGRDPAYAPNQLALAEGLAVAGEAAAAREAARRALRLAEEAAGAGVPEAADWLRQARELGGAE